jgi:hypothetical protein
MLTLSNGRMRRGSSAEVQLPALYSNAHAKFLLVAGYDPGVAGRAQHYGSEFTNAAVARMGAAEQVRS